MRSHWGKKKTATNAIQYNTFCVWKTKSVDTRYENTPFNIFSLALYHVPGSVGLKDGDVGL